MSKIAIYAGHGGTDSGAVGQNGELEKDYTLRIATAAINALNSAGYDTITNRTSDISRDIAADANTANSAGVDYVAEIHLNSNDGAPATGTEVYYSITGGNGKQLAQNILNEITALGYKSRGIKTKKGSSGRDYFGIIRRTIAPAVLIEVCFINNPDDMVRLDCEAAGRAIASGIMKMYGENAVGDTDHGSGTGSEQTTPPEDNVQTPSGDGTDTNGKEAQVRKAKTAELQQILNEWYGSGLNVDGIWGPKTAAACNNNLLKYKSPMIRTTYVTYTQQLLGVAGFSTNVDGAYGPDTKAKVIDFQRSASLSVDGIVGKNTTKALIDKFVEIYKNL